MVMKPVVKWLARLILGRNYHRVASRFGARRRQWPSYLDGSLRRLRKRDIEYGRFSALNRISLEFTGTDCLPGKISLPLVSRTIEVVSSPPWNISFEDKEDGFCLNRFAWALPLLLETGRRDILLRIVEWMKDWIRENPEDISSSSWESYSVSERIINWIFLLSLLEEDEWDKEIGESLLQQGCYLVRNLEYYGDRETNNHYLNNARALFILGAVFQVEVFRRVGRVILQNHLPISFTEQGYLRERSSHYNLLLAKNLWELLTVASETGFADELGRTKDLIERIVRSAGIFITGDKKMILWGDVSPDATPEWLLEGWRKLWKSAPLFDRIENSELVRDDDAGFLRWNRDDWSIFLFYRLPDSERRLEHSHQDTGSFCVCYRDIPILVDPGRKDYRYELEGRDSRGMQEKFHSLFRMEGMSPGWFQRTNGVADNPRLQKNTLSLRWKNLKGDTVNARFVVEKERLVIHVDDTGTRRILGTLVLDPEIQVLERSSDRFMLESGKERFGLVLEGEGGKTELKTQAYFPAYGREVTTQVIRCVQNNFAKVSINLGQWAPTPR